MNKFKNQRHLPRYGASSSVWHDGDKRFAVWDRRKLRVISYHPTHAKAKKAADRLNRKGA
jgi:hypothetical protein